MSQHDNEILQILFGFANDEAARNAAFDRILAIIGAQPA